MFSAQYYAESNVQEFREYHNKNLWQVEKELSEINNDIPIVEWITYLGFPLIITTVIIYRVKRFKES